VEIQDGTIRNPAILSFQHRAPEYPTSAAEAPAGRSAPFMVPLITLSRYRWNPGKARPRHLHKFADAPTTALLVPCAAVLADAQWARLAGLRESALPPPGSTDPIATSTCSATIAKPW
jgi:hypothetical protein